MQKFMMYIHTFMIGWRYNGSQGESESGVGEGVGCSIEWRGGEWPVYSLSRRTPPLSFSHSLFQSQPHPSKISQELIIIPCACKHDHYHPSSISRSLRSPRDYLSSAISLARRTLYFQGERSFAWASEARGEGAKTLTPPFRR